MLTRTDEFDQLSRWLRQRQDAISYAYAIRCFIPDNVAARLDAYQHLLDLCAE